MNEQIKNTLTALCGRSGTHYIEEYFQRKEKSFNVVDFLKITQDELLSSWISMNYKNERLQISLKLNQ